MHISLQPLPGTEVAHEKGKIVRVCVALQQLSHGAACQPVDLGFEPLPHPRQVDCEQILLVDQ
jgi:hypothetical protein